MFCQDSESSSPNRFFSYSSSSSGWVWAESAVKLLPRMIGARTVNFFSVFSVAYFRIFLLWWWLRTVDCWRWSGLKRMIDLHRHPLNVSKFELLPTSSILKCWLSFSVTFLGFVENLTSECLFLPFCLQSLKFVNKVRLMDWIVACRMTERIDKMRVNFVIKFRNFPKPHTPQSAKNTCLWRYTNLDMIYNMCCDKTLKFFFTVGIKNRFSSTAIRHFIKR